MPDYETPREAATAAYDALRFLAHTARTTPTRELYDLNRELLGIARLLPDVLQKLASLALARGDEATIRDGGTIASGAAVIEAAARDLISAAEQINRAETRLDRTSQHLSLLTWETPRPAAGPAQAASPVIGTLAPKGVTEAARHSPHLAQPGLSR